MSTGFDEDKFRDFRRRVQGKYFVGDEVAENCTYVHVVKVTDKTDPNGFSGIDYDCIANVCCAGEYGIYNAKGHWWFSDDRIRFFHYKKISKSEFARRIKSDCYIDYKEFQERMKDV